MRKLSPRFISFHDSIVSEMESVEGFLAPWEIQFLALLAAYPTTEGEILEIGSFKGKSTVVLAKANRFVNSGTVHAVDPMTSPAESDPDVEEGGKTLADFEATIAAHGVADDIRLYQMRSKELAKQWNKQLRLLWIDGDHSYAGVKEDFDCFRPQLADRAIVAIHDVLHEFDGCLRVFMEEILLSRHFGPCGLVGSIGWAQFHANEGESEPYIRDKLSLYKRLSRLLPYVAFGNKPKGLEKKKYKVLRSRIPRRPVRPDEWIAKIKDHI